MSRGTADRGDKADRTGKEEVVSDRNLPIREPITTTPSRPVRGARKVVYELNNPEDGWNRLGSYHFPADSVSIRLSNQTDGRRVIADAVKWVKK